MALNVVKLLLVVSVLSLVGCGGAEDADADAVPPLVVPIPAPVTAPAPSGGGAGPVCDIGEVQTQSCSTDIPNSLIANQILSCKADRMGFDISSCKVETCEIGFTLDANQCVEELVEEPIEEPVEEPVVVDTDLVVSSTRPRILFTPQKFQDYQEKLTGPTAIEPFITIYQKMVEREDSFLSNPSKAGLVNLAIIYAITSEDTYKSAYLSGLNHNLDRLLQNNTLRVDNELMVSMDLMWSHIGDEQKLKFMDVASTDNRFYYRSQDNLVDDTFNYHGAWVRVPAFLAAGLVVGDEILDHDTITKNPEKYRFDPILQLQGLRNEIERDDGSFLNYERRIAGDMTYNTALPGELGGLYDNFSYDNAEEAVSVLLVRAYDVLFNKDISKEYLHDKYRGYFYQNMSHPNAKAPRLWTSNIAPIEGPNSSYTSMAADSYADGYMQYYANKMVEDLKATSFEYLLDSAGFLMYFFNQTLDEIRPDTNNTSTYFSGPGLVTMRESFKEDSPHAVFLSGEGISRRYEDTNSFMLFHKEEIVVHAGARFRSSDVNDEHHKYAITSLSKNTIRVVDPLETFDNDERGDRGELYSGPRLRDDYNFGGQLSEGTVYDVNGNSIQRNRLPGVENLHNSGDINKYEFVNGKYTYVRGKGEFAYTRKVVQFDRDFVYLGPNKILIFDRLKVNNAANEKIWNMHTVYQPLLNDGDAPVVSRGIVSSTTAGHLVVEGQLQRMHVNVLLPQNREIYVRGGESFIVENMPLNSSTSIANAEIGELDTYRPIEVIINGSDLVGEITVVGNTETQTNVTEVLSFVSSSSVDIERGRATSGSGSDICDNTKNWKVDEFKGAVVQYYGNEEAVITGNSENTLYGDFPAGWSNWIFIIKRYVVNTSNKFNKITTVTTDNMDIDQLDLRVLHYFDAENANGSLHSFAPQSDGIKDFYTGQKQLGRYNINVKATDNNTQEYFFNVISMDELSDVYEAPIDVSSASLGAAIVNRALVIFPKALTATNSDLEVLTSINETDSILATGLTPNTEFYVLKEASSISLSMNDNGGTALTSSDMGTLFYEF